MRAAGAQGQGVPPPGNTSVYLTVLLERLLAVDQRAYSFEVIAGGTLPLTLCCERGECG
jgi:hypothetical protein